MRVSRLAPLVVLAAALVGCTEFPKKGQPGYFVVDGTEDAVDATPGNGKCATAAGRCTLRAAIMESNALPGASTVVLPAGAYTLSLAGSGGAERGDLDVTDGVQLLGGGTQTTVIDGNGDVLRARIFLHARERLHLSDLTLQNGGSPDVPYGGCVRSDSGTLILRRVAVRGCESFSGAGALLVSGLASIEDSTLDGNTTASRGGALWVDATAIVGIERSTLSNNTATLGGAIYSGGSLGLDDVTVSGNTGTNGAGGINTFGQLDLNNVTVTNNESRQQEGSAAGGLANVSREGVVRMRNTVIAGNRQTFGGGPDCSGEVRSEGYNLVKSPARCTLTGDLTGNLTGVEPLLGALAGNGGPTLTHALSSRSPARNAGSPAAPGSSATACRPTDQRGVARPVDGRCDMGATEQ